MADSEEESYDHADAKRRLRRLKAEQESRKRRIEEARRREEESLREQIKSDEEKMQARMQERELEQQRQREERIARAKQEREHRREERTQFKKQMQIRGPQQVPLYKRREEEYQRKLDEEAAARREELRKKRQAYEPIDFVKLKAEAVEREQALQSARQARRAARLEAEREASSVLPPLSHYYAGKVHERIVAEQHEQKRKVEIQREKARNMQLKAQRYAKLVAELDPAKPSEAKPSVHKQSQSPESTNSVPKPRRLLGLAADGPPSSNVVPSAHTLQLQALGAIRAPAEPPPSNNLHPWEVSRDLHDTPTLTPTRRRDCPR
ncbi:MAG: hypothetical protein SGPRY_013259 [Prymnesium sp.]